MVPTNDKSGLSNDQAQQLKVLWEKHLKGLGALGVVAWLVGAIGVAGIGSAVWQHIKLSSVSETISAAIKELEVYQEGLRAAAASMLVPPGTVCVWPAPQPGPGSAWNTYWHACDGGDVEFNEELWKVLKGHYGNPDAVKVDRIKLPDFRGHFLRGADAQLADSIGRSQDWATALPHRPFKTGGELDGQHAHKFTGFGLNTSKGDGGGVSLNGHFVKWDGGTTDKFMDRGPHSHTITSGGDTETRPKNYAIHWVIRVK